MIDASDTNQQKGYWTTKISFKTSEQKKPQRLIFFVESLIIFDITCPLVNPKSHSFAVFSFFNPWSYLVQEHPWGQWRCRPFRRSWSQHCALSTVTKAGFEHTTPGLTKNALHTILINRKFLVIQFYTYRIVWNLYNKHFHLTGNCMIGGFTINQKVVFVSNFIFWKVLGSVCNPSQVTKTLVSQSTKGWTVLHLSAQKVTWIVLALSFTILSYQRLRYAHKKLKFACKFFFGICLFAYKIRFAVEKKTNKFLAQVFKITYGNYIYGNCMVGFLLYGIVWQAFSVYGGQPGLSIWE